MSELKLNLKNARRLETAISGAISNIESNVLGAQMNVSIYDDQPADMVAKYITTIEVGVADVTKLIEMRYAIRNAISRANHESGLNALMAAERAANDEAHYLQSLLERATTMDSVDVERLTRKLEARKAGKVESGYLNNGEKIALIAPMPSEAIQRFKSHAAVLKRRKTEIVDKCAALNVTTIVELSGLNVELLQELDLL